MLDDRTWLADQYRSRTGVEIARELGVSTRTVYAAMDGHGIARRTRPAVLTLRHPELADESWLAGAVERNSSGDVAAELEVSAGTVTAAYRRAGLDPGSTPLLYARGRTHQRPPPAVLHSLWGTEDGYRGVGRRLGVAHSTAAVWLAEVGVFQSAEPALSRTALSSAIDNGWPLTKIATEHRTGVTTVKVELHRHKLFEAHRHRHRAAVQFGPP